MFYSAGFSVRTDILQHEYSSGIATGNWGCGAFRRVYLCIGCGRVNLVFRGDPQLKMLIQWLAASCVGVLQIKIYLYLRAYMLRSPVDLLYIRK